MSSTLEQRVVSSLRSVLVSESLGPLTLDAPELRAAVDGLDRLLPQFLPGFHEDLDGVIPLVATKTGENELQMFGLCILLGDQTVVPFHFQLQISLHRDVISWIDLQLGERVGQAMARTPYELLHKVSKRLYASGLNADAIDWVYHGTHGRRRMDAPTQ